MQFNVAMDVDGVDISDFLLFTSNAKIRAFMCNDDGKKYLLNSPFYT